MVPLEGSLTQKSLVTSYSSLINRVTQTRGEKSAAKTPETSFFKCCINPFETSWEAQRVSGAYGKTTVQSLLVSKDTTSSYWFLYYCSQDFLTLF
jgi:hypothetical protein